MRPCFLLLPILLLAPDALAQDPPDMGWTGVLDERAFAALHHLEEGETPALRGSMVEVGDAAAYLSLPEGDKPSAAVLVIHEWWGLNDHIKHWTDRLAADGYAALAVDLYDGTVATNRDDALAAMRGVDEERALATLRAAHRFLAADPRVQATRRACIGWCFGGGWSLRLAMAEPELDAAVVYYGRLVTDGEQLASIRAPMLGVFGNLDRGIPRESVDAFEQAMRTADKDLRVLRYEANHAFANPSSARYDAAHADHAWQQVRAFLATRLTGVTGHFDLGDRRVGYRRPATWRDAGERTMRAVNLAIGDDVECYVTVLGGNGGGVAANLNRWRGQMGQEPLSEEEIDALPRLPMLGSEGTRISIEGDYHGMSNALDGAAMLGAVCLLDGGAVFVKMIGPKQPVLAQSAAFDAFCTSMR